MTFDILKAGSRATKYGDEPWQTLSFEMNLDLETADRNVYNVLDWISTLGGFLRGLRIIFTILLLVPLYNYYELTMVEHLYQS